MTLAIFVARDSEEHGKYQKWFEKNAINESYAVSLGYTVDSTGEVGQPTVSGRNAPGAKECKIECKGFQKRMADDLLVLMIEKTKAFPFPNGYQSVATERDKIVKQIAEVAKAALEWEKVENAAADEVRIFIHWGGGEPLVYEREFSESMKNFEFKNATAFAVSSRRRGCLDVSGDMIMLPDTKEKLDELIGRFTFDLVKDVMFQYVLENEDRREKSAKEESAKEPAKESGKFEVNSVDGQLLQSYLSYMQKNWERWSGARMLIKLLLEQMKKTANELGKDCQLELNDQTAALFSYLLREGVRHG